MAVAPYPHIKMGVRDESIATILEEEIMPLDKPLYMIRAKKGPVGVPIWCPTYTRATQVFGVDTFNPRSKYYSEASYFLLKTMTMNGAFLMRVADESVKESKVWLEVGVQENVDIPLWERNSITGAFNLADDGSRIKACIDSSTGKARACKKLTSNLETYIRSTNTAITAGNDYYYREYNQYKFVPFKASSPTANSILWYGVGDPEIDQTFTADQVTETLLASNFVFKNTGTADSPVLVYVDSATGLDNSKFYHTIKFDEYEAVVVPAGTNPATLVSGSDPDTVNDGLGRFYTREAVVDGGVKQYKKLNVGASAGATVDVVYNDLIASNGDILRKTIQPVYTVLTTEQIDAGPVAGTKYYIASTEVPGTYILASADGTLTAFANTQAQYYTKSDVEVTTYIGNWGNLYNKSVILQAGEMEPQGVLENGVRLYWRAVQRLAADARAVDDLDPSQDVARGIVWYPIMAFVATNPGKWGEDFGFRFYYDRTQNTLAATVGNQAVKYALAPVEWKEDDTTPSAITNAYGENAVNGTARLNVYDATTGLDISLKKLVPANYSGSRELPVTMYWMTENFQTVGRILMNHELAAKSTIGSLYPDLCEKKYDSEGNYVGREAYVTFVEELLNNLGVEGAAATALNGLEGAGYMANIVSAVSSSKVPYFASEVIGTYNEATDQMTSVGDGIVDMNGDAAFRLGGGEDGPINDWDIEKYQRYQIDACIAGTQEYLVDYLRCPYNNIIDTGVSIATKKSYLDFMGVRDNLTVYLTPQQIWKTQDALGNTVYPEELTRYEDESVGAMLRSYGLLMREDIENSTEANRAIIFLASGINSDHDWNPKNLVASTLWVALKNAQYLSGQKITAEPIERPNSEITCYDKGMTWTAASEETRSRCWNAGLNYAQYFDQDGIHYAACRSIYKYDTSVLCDMGTVRAVTFAKDIIRKEWAIWAGSKRKADDLNARITKALTNKIATMLNQKYDFSVSVYQTDEDKQYGYVRHVDLTVTSPATNRVWLATIIVKREGFDANAEA